MIVSMTVVVAMRWVAEKTTSTQVVRRGGAGVSIDGVSGDRRGQQLVSLRIGLNESVGKLKVLLATVSRARWL